MSDVPTTDAVVTLWRRVYDAGTKKSTLAQVGDTTPIYIAEVRATRAQIDQGLPEYTTRFLIDGAVSIREGDQVRGYNPTGALNPPIYSVYHLNSTTPPRKNVQSGELRVLEQAGGNR